MRKNIELQLEKLQREINRREATLKTLYKAKQALEIECFHQEYDVLLKYMDQKKLDAATVLKMLKEKKC